MMGLSEAKGLFECPDGFPGLAPLRSFDRVLRLWLSPSFTPPMSWTLYVSSSTALVRRVVLVRDERMQCFAPWGSDGAVPLEVAAELTSSLEAITVPPFLPSSGFGLDGTRYGVERASFHLAGRLTWWESPPEAWAALGAWYQRAVELFERSLPAHRHER
jgi:hypothetical protein